MKQKLFFVIIFLASANLVFSELPPGTKGTLKLEVEVQDELGIDTVSQSIQLKNIRASEIEPFIRSRLSRWGIVQVNDALNMVIITDKKPKIDDLVKLVQQLDVEGLEDFLRLHTVSIPLNYTEANSIKNLVQAQLSPEGSLLVDSDHNTLVITDVKTKIDLIKKLVEKIDVFVPQVVIEARVVEISGDYIRKVGIDWSALGLMSGQIQTSWNASTSKGRTETKSQTITETKTDGTYTKSEGPITTSIQESFSQNTPVPSWQVSGYLDLDKIFNFVNILVNENNAKILSMTRIVTTNNKTGTITAGEKIFYKPMQWGQRSGEYERTTGLTLQVTPRVGKDNVVTLSVNSNLDNLTGWSPDGNPIVINRSVNSNVVLKDSETFVLGGFEKATTVDSEKGIPILRSILPFIFSRKIKTEVKSQIIIFLTPYVKRELGYAPEEDLQKLKK